jgi:hypothetical protein
VDWRAEQEMVREEQMTDRELMQMALDSIVYYAGGEDNLYGEDKDLLKALRDRLEQPEPEPVLWAEIGKEYMRASDEPFENAIPLYAAPPEFVNLDAVDKFYENKLKLKEKSG